MSVILRWLWRANPSARRVLAAKIHDGVNEGVLTNPHIAAKFYPYLPHRTSYLIRPPSRRRDYRSELVVPPRELWWGYAETPEQYLAMGQLFVESMKEVLQTSGTPVQAYDKILDFGCGSGIMIRWLCDLAERGDVWGVDISSEHMLWCQQHLSPPFKFVTTTSFPHLPFEDRYFDFIYAGSVFTHIADLAEAWLMELRRIVRPGGRLYLTIQDERSIELCMAANHNPPVAELLRAYDEESHFMSTGYDFFTINRTPGQGGPGQAQVFYRRDYVRRHWGLYLNVVSLTPERYDIQTAVLLER